MKYRDRDLTMVGLRTSGGEISARIRFILSR